MVFPFLPLYINEIGVKTWGSVEFWAGMVFSAQAITMMISAPLWGAVADRYGRKIMLIRATLGGAILITLMGFVQSAEQLTLLRAVQGLVTGTIPAANALVASSAPKGHSGEALGLLQTGTWIGVAVGPLIGGVIGDAFGFRESFWVTGSLLALSGLAIILWVQEDFKPAGKIICLFLFASGFRQLGLAADPVASSIRHSNRGHDTLDQCLDEFADAFRKSGRNLWFKCQHYGSRPQRCTSAGCNDCDVVWHAKCVCCGSGSLWPGSDGRFVYPSYRIYPHVA